MLLVGTYRCVWSAPLGFGEVVQSLDFFTLDTLHFIGLNAYTIATFDPSFCGVC